MKTILTGLAAVAALSAAANAAVVIGPSAVNFTDISASGTVVPTPTVGDDTEHTISAALLGAAGFTGNELLAGGVPIRVGNNGGVLWNPVGTQEVGWLNANIGNPGKTTILTMSAATAGDTVNGNGAGNTQFLMPLWDDNTPATSGTSLRWQVISGDLIVQWTNEDHFIATGAGTITYQMIVHSGVTLASGASLVDFVYNDTLYAANQYQDDGGSASIGYKNWGVNPNANDVEFGISGGNGTSSLTEPAFGGIGMQPKVGGWVAANNVALPHSVTITGVSAVPEPTSLALLGLAGMALVARRRRSI